MENDIFKLLDNIQKFVACVLRHLGAICTVIRNTHKSIPFSLSRIITRFKKYSFYVNLSGNNFDRANVTV